MKLESKSLGKVFDFVTFEKEENGKVVKIILHDSLEDVIHNQCENVDYDVTVVSSERDHCVACCTMRQGNRKIVAYGETVPETLENDIARNHPCLIATQRAFDRAAIRFLALPGKVFSNLELAIDDFLPSDVVVSSNETVNVTTEIEEVIDETPLTSTVEEVTETVVEEPAQSGIVSSVVVSDDDSVMIADDLDELNELGEIVLDDSNDVAGDISDMLPFEFENSNDELAKAEAYTITMSSKYSGKTIGEIYKEAPTWITDFMLKQFKPYNESAKMDLEAVKKFAKLKGI